jgi:alpha-tubulin suppressor-like RCC1 family protein
MFVTHDDKVYTFGKNCFGFSGLGHMNLIKTLTIVEELCNKQIIRLFSGHYFAETENGEIFRWGFNKSRQFGNGCFE